jgi:hypothetical protein
MGAACARRWTTRANRDERADFVSCRRGSKGPKSGTAGRFEGSQSSALGDCFAMGIGGSFHDAAKTAHRTSVVRRADDLIAAADERGVRSGSSGENGAVRALGPSKIRLTAGAIRPR